MATLVLQIAGPWQSWGSDSKFGTRATEPMPTKSGIIGLLAAAQGVRRSDPLEELLALRFGVRADQPGTRQRDFQTVRNRNTGKSMPLTYRDYLADARFLVGLEGPSQLLDGLGAAIACPTFPLYLGRRSCPPAGRLVRGVREKDVVETLRSEEWFAADWYRKTQPAVVPLSLSFDADPDDAIDERLRDQPISFDTRSREYGWRAVRHDWVEVVNPEGRAGNGHNPMDFLEAI